MGFNHGQCLWGRGRILGGSSSINYMLYVRGLESDYDHWKDLGNDGWGWKDVLPYFEKSLDGHLNISYAKSWNKMREVITSAIKQAGYPSTRRYDAKTGTFETLQTIYNGTRSHTAKAFLSGLSARRNLKIAVHTQATKILFRDNQAVGVTVLHNNCTINLYVDKEVILSGGSINSPQLLMLSGIGPQRDLNQLGITTIANLQVGKNLQDHLLMFGVFIAVDSIPNNTIDECYASALYCNERRGPLGTTDIVNIFWFFNTKNKSSERPNIQIISNYFERNNTEYTSQYLSYVNLNQSILNQVVEANKYSSILNMLPALSSPKSRGYIKLRSTDPLAKPLIYPRYLTEQIDMDTMVASIDHIKQVISTPAMQNLNARLLKIIPPNCADLTFDTREFWECSFRNMATTIFHHSGTCKMGPECDPESVVDDRLRVRNVRNLRVIDGSIMPKIIRRNTNAACMMIGEKGADLIKEDWVGT